MSGTKHQDDLLQTSYMKIPQLLPSQIWKNSVKPNEYTNYNFMSRYLQK